MSENEQHSETSTTTIRESVWRRWPSTAPLPALLAAFCLVLTSLLFPSHYETNDDLHSTMIVSGVGITNTPDYHGLPNNATVFLMYPLQCLYQAYPHVTWYGAYLFAVLLVGFFIIALVFIHRCKPSLGTLAFAVFFLTTGVFIVSSLQFTSASSLLALSGLLLGSLTIFDKKPRLSIIAIATVLVVFASLMRIYSFLLMGAVSAATVLIGTAGKPHLWRQSIRPLAWLVFMAAVCISLNLLSGQFYDSNEGWKSARKFHETVYPISSNFCGDLNYKDNATALNKLGLTANDIELMSNYFFADKKIFSTEVLRQARQIAPRKPDFKPEHIISFLFHRLLPIILFSALIFPLLNSSLVTWRHLLIWLGYLSAILIYLEFWAKLPDRGYLPLLACTTSTLLLCLDSDKIARTFASYKQLRPYPRRLVAASACCATLIGSCLFYRETLWAPTSQAREQNLQLKASIKALNPSPGQLYVNMSPGLPYELMSPWDDLSRYYTGFDIYKTNFLSHTPIGDSMLRKHHIDNALEAVNSGQAFLISEPYLIRLYATFCKEHYGENVTCEPILENKEIDLHVYRVHRQQ